MANTVNTPLPIPSDKVMRKAVTERDERFDGSFVYGVVTTGVYCRPSCKSRPAESTVTSRET
jgi:methylphosphotriester-DNA--protein-cysteine methyltransferase